MADTITIRTSTERDVVKIVERGPQGPAGGGGGGGSGTVTSVALAGTGLSITGSPVTASGTITANVSYGTTAGTACQGNDSRLSNARTPTAHTHPSSDITDLKTNGNAAGLWDSVNDEQLVSTGDGELQIRKTGTALSGAFNAGQITVDRGYNLPDASGTLALTTTVVDNATGLWDSVNNGQLLSAGDGELIFNKVNYPNVYALITPESLTAVRFLTLPDASGTLALTSNITKSAVGLGNVTNNAQTQAAIVPNTAPSAGQLLVGNAGGTAYAPATLSGDATIASTGALTLANTSTARTNIGLGNVPNVDTTNAANISSGVLPNARVNWAAPSALGSTTAAAGTFTTLSANNGTLTASAPVLDLAQTWNNAAVTFRGVNWSFVETAAGGSSEVFRISTGAAGTTGIFAMRRDGNATFGNGVNVGTIGGSAVIAGQNGQWRVSSGGAFGFCDAAANAYGTMDTAIFRDAADTLAMRRLANPQAFRLYNTTDAGLTNFERGFMRWSSNVLQIGTEKGGTGSARALEFSIDGTTRLSISASTGNTLIASNNSLIFTSCGRLVPSGTDGVMSLVDFANSGWNRLNFGGTTSSFPALKRSSTTLQVRLADDTAYSVLDAQLRAQGTAPATSGAAGTAGDIRYDADYIYVCTATNTWKRAAIATW